MYFRVNLKMKMPTCCYSIWIASIELNFTVAFLLIRKTWDGSFVGNSVHPSPFLPGVRGGLLGDGGMTFFNGYFSFYIKNKLKSEIFRNQNN